MPSRTQLSARIKQAAVQAGFELAGVAAVSRETWRELDYFREWIEAGYAAEMDYLKTRDPEGRLTRAAVDRAFPWARSVVVCAINYNTPAPNSTDCPNPARGWISRYAWGGEQGPGDYHDSVLRRLRLVEEELHRAALEAGEPLPQTRCYVDTGPIVERVAARYAGIGWIGKNACVIHPQLGSWLFLGVVLASLELKPDLPAPDRCGTCTACIEACPTDALLAPYQLDAARCISYLTIEKRGSIPEALRPGMGRHVFGCDICQDVCPWNRRAPASVQPEFQPRTELVNPALEWLAAMREEE
ncbi:MAG: tRNA epoxyqueuosine(34) reductase QueG, partial [Terriglobales bacterium]